MSTKYAAVLQKPNILSKQVQTNTVDPTVSIFKLIPN